MTQTLSARSFPEGTVWCQRWDEAAIGSPPLPAQTLNPQLLGSPAQAWHPLPQRYTTPGPSPFYVPGPRSLSPLLAAPSDSDSRPSTAFTPGPRSLGPQHPSSLSFRTPDLLDP